MSRHSQEHDLKRIKAAAKAQFGQVDGVEGIGIGARTLRIYVRDESVRNRLPSEFKGVAIDVVVTGTIEAVSDG